MHFKEDKDGDINSKVMDVDGVDNDTIDVENDGLDNGGGSLGTRVDYMSSVGVQTEDDNDGIGQTDVDMDDYPSSNPNFDHDEDDEDDEDYDQPYGNMPLRRSCYPS